MNALSENMLGFYKDRYFRFIAVAIAGQFLFSSFAIARTGLVGAGIAQVGPAPMHRVVGQGSQCDRLKVQHSSVSQSNAQSTAAQSRAQNAPVRRAQ